MLLRLNTVELCCHKMVVLKMWLHYCSRILQNLNIWDFQNGLSSGGGLISRLVLKWGSNVYVLFIFFFSRQRRGQHYNDEFSSLTYTNPNYQRTSTETINSDRPPREWRIFRFNKRAVSDHF